MAGVGQRIKELRKASKMTQQELAEGVVTRSYISQIEKGLIQPSYDTLEKLAQKLNCTVEEFFKEPENKALIITDWKKHVRFAEGYAESGQFAQAQKLLDSLESVSQEDLNDFDLGILYWVKGKLLEQKNQSEEAIPLYQKSLDHLEKYIDSKEKLRSLDSLACCYLQLNRNLEALQVLSVANEAIIRYHIGGLIKTSVFLNTGVAHAKLGEHYSAIGWLKEAACLNQSMNTHYKAGHINLTLGICHMQIGKEEEAVTYFKRAADFYEFSGDTENKACAITHLGMLYTNIGRLRQAIDALRTAIGLYTELREERGMTDPAEAARLHARSINALLELSRAYLLHDDTNQVVQICEDIIRDAADPQHKAFAYQYLGEVDFKLGRYEDALRRFEASYHFFQQAKYHKDSFLIQQKMADTYYELKQYEQAARLYKQRIEATNPPPGRTVTP
jgi:tetratricopeptide (TPR) repeat protein